MKHSSAILPRTYSYNEFSLGNFHSSSFAIEITACRLKTADNDYLQAAVVYNHHSPLE